MDRPPGHNKKVAVVERWPLVEVDCITESKKKKKKKRKKGGESRYGLGEHCLKNTAVCGGF